MRVNNYHIMRGGRYLTRNTTYLRSAYRDGHNPDHLIPDLGFRVEKPKKTENRLFRGGAWHLLTYDSRSAFRHWLNSDYNDIDIGFRLVRPIKGNQDATK